MTAEWTTEITVRAPPLIELLALQPTATSRNGAPGSSSVDLLGCDDT